MTTRTPDPPRHLSRGARAFWRDVVRDYDLEPHHRRVLTAAAEAWDRMLQARELLDADGITYTDRFGAPRKHPAVSIEENARIAFLRAVRELALDDDDVPEARPPRR